jgi:DNA replication protein DnaC
MINTDATLEQLEQLKLLGMAQAYRGALAMPSHEQLTANELLARLVEAEGQHRLGIRTQMYLRLSKLRYDAVLEQVQCSPSRNLTRDELLSLSDCSFIQRSENILITGATGCGKSYLACALGRQACSLGYKVYYLGMNRFIERLILARLDGTYIIPRLNRFAKS